MLRKITLYNRERHVGGHFGINTIARNLLTSGYCWPTLNNDSTKMCQTCDICQRFTSMCQSGKGSLQPVMAFEPFMK